MKEVRYFFAPQATLTNELPADETAHALRVLRLSAGDELFLMDGQGTFYRAVVTLASHKQCLYDILETLPQQKTWKGRVHLAVAPTKMMERIEWLAEKATEVGIDELSFLNCQFSERRNLRADRIEKIVVSAVKQSRKPYVPLVHPLRSFADFISEPRVGRKFIAHCYDQFPRADLFELLRESLPIDDVTILIGPEGDFSVDEVQKALACGYESVSLGSSRLRTETAALSSVMMFNLVRRTP